MGQNLLKSGPTSSSGWVGLILTIHRRGVGGAHDSMAYQNGRPFNTPDPDNDAWVEPHNCAAVYGGVW